MEDRGWKMEEETTRTTVMHSTRAILHPPSSILAVILSASLCLGATFPAFGDDGWSLTTADFKRQTVSLRSLDESGAKVVPFGESGPVTIPFDKLLQLDRGASVQQVRGAYTLYLTSGDRVGGEPVSIAGDN